MIEIIKDNVGTWRDFKLRMTGKPNSAPRVKRSLITPLRSQGVLDFSRSPYEEVFFDEKPLPYTFSRIIDSYQQREQLAHEIRQWAYQFTDGYLFDTSAPNYYYKDVSCVGCAIDTKTALLTVKLDFMAYPRKIHQYAEGHGLWDVFDFDNDVWQNTVFRIPDITEQLPYKLLSIGDEVNLGGWLSWFGGDRLGSQAFEEMYTIEDIRDYNGNLDYSSIQYKLKGIQYWVNDYFIPQAHTKPTKIELINTSSFPVIPQVLQYGYGGLNPLAGMSIELETGAMYTLRGRAEGNLNQTTDTYNTTFALMPGVNKLNLYGSSLEVHFKWHKEVI